MKKKQLSNRILAIFFAIAMTLFIAAPVFECVGSYAETSEKDAVQETPVDVISDWEDTVTVDGVTVKAELTGGTLPKEASLSVEKIQGDAGAAILAMLDQVRETGRVSAAAYIYEVSILNAAPAAQQDQVAQQDQAAQQPAEEGTVRLSLIAGDLAGPDQELKIYRTESGRAQALDTGDTGENSSEMNVYESAGFAIDVTEAEALPEEPADDPEEDAEDPAEKAEEPAENAEDTDADTSETNDEQIETDKGDKDKPAEDISELTKEEGRTQSKAANKKAAAKGAAAGTSGGSGNLRSTPATGLSLGTNRGMLLLITVAVLAGALFVTLTVRRINMAKYSE